MKEKNKNFIKLICILILAGIIFVFIAYNSISGHEKIHKKIFSRYDISSEMNVSIFSGTVMPNVSEHYKCNDACKTQHTLNDVISYGIDDIVFTLFGIFFIYLLYREWVRE